ncbi:acyltransferase family protein [Saezia sanguinis]|uniref:acyltransferase family protein n=1 Tax=Saezia sanguinis TaxID=1965230 RepID=UPI00306B2000
MTYKPEIDGLRAVAVLLVLLCHMQLGAPGGFIGVDVFFVISGFLITSIVVGGMTQGKFSFWNFYGRRFVRLYPALIVVTLLTLLAGILLTDPVTLENLSRSGRYAITSTSNIFFRDHLGYFAIAAQKQPFLHTWSLGVEWQFYLVWPVIIWLVLKFSKKMAWLVAVLALITIGSIAASQWAISHDPKGAYYLMHFRAFELGIGALLVFIYEKQASMLTSVSLMIAGMAAIICSAFFYSPATPFPGVAALLPCLGAAACIYGGKGFVAGNILRCAPVVYIGKISYSVYLVHWPLLVLYTYYVYRDIRITEKIMLVLVSLLLGALVYRLVEQRINWKRLANKKTGCAVMMALVVASTGAMLYTGKYGEGLPWRAATPELQNASYLTWGGKGFAFTTPLGNPQGHELGIIAGDSFAGSLSIGVNAALQDSDQMIQQITYPGCVISEIDASTQVTQECRVTSAQAIDRARTQGLPLILVQAWGTSVTLDERNVAILSDYRTRESYTQFIENNLNDIRAKIGHQPLILVASVPYRRWGEDEKECLMRPALATRNCLQQLEPYPPRQTPVAEFNDFLKNYADSHEQVYYIDPAPALCPGGMCNAMRNAMLYNDGFHLSAYGSVEAGAYIVQEIRRILNTPATPEPSAQPSNDV